MTEPYDIGDVLVVEVFEDDDYHYGSWVGEIADRYVASEMWYTLNWLLRQCYDNQGNFKAVHVREHSGSRLHCPKERLW